MTEEEKRIVAELMEKHEEFRKLKEEHASLEEQLDEIYSSKKYFAPDEEVEVKTIKRRKLQLKDQMNVIISKVKRGEITL